MIEGDVVRKTIRIPKKALFHQESQVLEFPKSLFPHFHLSMQSNQKVEDVKGENNEGSGKRKGISRWQQKVHDKSDKQRLNVAISFSF